MRSIWSAHYEIQRDARTLFHVREENPWVKVIDGFLGEIPIIGLLSNYVFHPAYRVTRGESDAAVMRSVKQPALFEGRFLVERVGQMTEDEERLALMGILMLLLLERDRG